MSVRCPRKYCGALMDARTDGHGVVTFVCEPCERNRRGFCRDCPSRRPNSWALRCGRCAKRRKLELGRERDRERYPRRRRQVLANHRHRNESPLWREYRRQYMRAYRNANPWNDFDRAYQRAYMAQRRADPAYRAKQNARKRELRSMRQQATA